ncbi:hypothetical protein RHMOL_Rhmol12G0009700 [Rhododendron molle]|uniref:Uncharacterized protein n=1 Tax=Rhododendron molle TaxID=49168 RepID=A0ACC0LE50_RHOML|nr:hypothetical protein RHMOL_Rhmol12G0009700 [Rhododendron molle]
MVKLWGLKKKKDSRKELWGGWRLGHVFKWKKGPPGGINFKISIRDGVVFRILYVLEAVVLVSTLCFFFLCCGCHI